MLSHPLPPCRIDTEHKCLNSPAVSTQSPSGRVQAYLPTSLPLQLGQTATTSPAQTRRPTCMGKTRFSISCSHTCSLSGALPAPPSVSCPPYSIGAASIGPRLSFSRARGTEIRKDKQFRILGGRGPGGQRRKELTYGLRRRTESIGSSRNPDRRDANGCTLARVAPIRHTPTPGRLLRAAVLGLDKAIETGLWDPWGRVVGTDVGC